VDTFQRRIGRNDQEKPRYE
jgi:hypothetical protein